MEILWAADFNADGSRRRPPASTMHGWLTKMRGTLLGDEALRSRGIREMKEAASVRKRRAQVKRRAATGKSIFSFLGFGKSNKSKQKPKVLQQQRPPQSRRTTHESHKSSRSSRPPNHPARPSYRSSHQSSRRTHDKQQSGQRRSSRR